MKKYKCHKIVEAMKIKWITVWSDGSATLFGHDKSDTLLGGDNEEQNVGAPWVVKHEPQYSGYFVRYEDGYSSYSPAEAFEAGYTEVKS